MTDDSTGAHTTGEGPDAGAGEDAPGRAARPSWWRAVRHVGYAMAWMAALPTACLVVYLVCFVVDLSVQQHIVASADVAMARRLADDGSVHTDLNGSWCGLWMLQGFEVGVEVHAQGVRWAGTEVDLDLFVTERNFEPEAAIGTAVLQVEDLRSRLDGAVAGLDLRAGYSALVFTGDLGPDLQDVEVDARPVVEEDGGLHLETVALSVGGEDVPLEDAAADPGTAALVQDVDVDLSDVPVGLEPYEASTDEGVVKVSFRVVDDQLLAGALR